MATNIKDQKQQTSIAKPRLVELFADRYNVDPKEIITTLVATAFSVPKNDPPATREELIQLLIVSNEYHLNPFIREIYAFRKKGGGIVPIIGIDGWIRIVERQPTYAGEEMIKGYDDDLGPDKTELGFWYECKIHRSDRKFPISRRQYYKENFRNTDPWRDMPTRMLQHRAYIQSARAAFGLGGIYDADEGEVIALGGGADLLPASPATSRKPATQAPEARPEPSRLIDENGLEAIQEKIAKTGIPDNLVLTHFEVGEFAELKADQVPQVLRFVEDNSP